MLTQIYVTIWPYGLKGHSKVTNILQIIFLTTFCWLKKFLIWFVSAVNTFEFAIFTSGEKPLAWHVQFIKYWHGHGKYNITFLHKTKYSRTLNISCTQSQNLNVSHLVFQLFLPQPLKPGVKSSMEIKLEQCDKHCSNYIWVINNFIAYQAASYIRGLRICTCVTCVINSSSCT